MRNIITVAKNQLPEAIRDLVHGNSVDVHLCESVEIGSIQWNGGTRAEYTLVELATGKRKPIIDSRPWPQSMWPIGKTELPAGFVIVEGGTFCGKPARGCVYARAADVAPALSKQPIELPHALRQVLAALSQYNSKGRERFRSDAMMSRVTWDNHIAKLCERGLCDKRGVLTVEGKNRTRIINSAILNPFCPEFRG